LQIQPDLEELEPNMEDIEDSDSSKDEVQLGRLHFSMDYDFTKSEVLGKTLLSTLSSVIQLT